MKLRFTAKEFEAFDKDMEVRGFKRVNQNQSYGTEDFHYYKTLRKEEPIDDERPRNSCVLIFKVYDFSKYERFREPETMHVSPMVMISRTIDERFDLDIINDSLKTIEHYIDFARSFYVFINQATKL